MDEHAKDTDFKTRREEMLDEISLGACLMQEQLGRDSFDERVIDAMRNIPRHVFVPEELQPYAYLNRPLSIGYDKTVSNPLILAVMTDLLQVGEDDVVLEIGTGLGYHAGLVSWLAAYVYSIEIVEELATEARQRLLGIGRRNVEVIAGNGARGLPSQGPFDRILVTAAPELMPPALINQLKPGGRMVIPAGLEGKQMLMLVIKDSTGRLSVQEILPVGFSPLEGDVSVVAS